MKSTKGRDYQWAGLAEEKWVKDEDASRAANIAHVKQINNAPMAPLMNSELVQAGVPISVLQEMGGWESIEMVRRYAHLAPNHLTEHAKQIETIFGNVVPNRSHLGSSE